MSLSIKAALLPSVLLAAAPAMAQTPREMLTYAAYQDNNAATAIVRIDRARAAALAASAHAPGDQDAAVIAAIALAYRAKLTGSRSEAIAARRGLEAVVARFPRNPEAQLALGAWHLGVIAKVGRFLARAGAGAQKGVGVAALDRAVALGGDRAMFTGIAGMLRVELDPGDPRGRELVEQASRGATPGPIDRINQRAAANVAAACRRSDNQAARALADRVLPFGWFKGG